MFFHITRVDTVRLPPAEFGKDIDARVLSHLRAKVEGRCSGRFGFTICVTRMLDRSKGRLHETGDAEFQYASLVFRPFKNQVLQAIVKDVHENGFQAQAGPCTILVFHGNLPLEYKFEASEQPMWVPGDVKDAEDASAGGAGAALLPIKKDCLVRVRIMNVKAEVASLTAVGRMNEDYLGVIEES